jgi:hypothetical protein
MKTCTSPMSSMVNKLLPTTPRSPQVDAAALDDGAALTDAIVVAPCTAVGRSGSLRKHLT